METTVVNCRKAHFDIYIGRQPEFGGPSKWCNPFIIGKDGTREEVIYKYERYLHERADLMNSLWELRGKVLGCHCHPEHCHGDVLALLANKLTENAQ